MERSPQRRSSILLASFGWRGCVFVRSSPRFFFTIAFHPSFVRRSGGHGPKVRSICRPARRHGFFKHPPSDQRSHGRDFACCPADSALAASVAVRLPASEGPVGRWKSIARFASCVATQVISPFTSRPRHRFLRANACQHRSAHHPAADRVPPYQRHCHIPGDLMGSAHSPVNFFDVLVLPATLPAIRAYQGGPWPLTLSGVPVVSRILPFQAVVFQPRLLAWRLVGIEWRGAIFARHGAPHQSPPADVHRALKHGRFPRRRNLPSHSCHQSEHPPWDRCPDAIALSSSPPGNRDWAAVGPISLAHAYGFRVSCSPRLRSPSQKVGRSSGSPMVQLLAYRPPGGRSGSRVIQPF